MQRLRPDHAAEMLFEPTGDLWKDYSAYCEIEDKAERDEIGFAIQVVEVKPPVVPASGAGAAAASGDSSSAPAAAPSPPSAAQQAGGHHAGSKVETHVIARNLEYCLGKKDALPLANAIPHCHTLTMLHLTGCGVTEHSLKLFVEAAYKSPSLQSVAIDFNPGGLYKDPTVSKRDRNEVSVNPAQYRGQHLRAAHDEPAGGDRGKAGAAKGDKGGAPAAGKGGAAAAAGKGGAAVAPTDADAEKQPIPLPTGWHALLLTGIQQLSLRGNGITDRQLEPLCALLETNNELVSLSLWGNAITSTGASALARALKVNRRLTALNVGHNNIDDVGVKALAEVLLSADVTNEEASKLRAKALRSTPNAADLPLLPGYADLFVVPGQPDADKKDKKKEAAGGGKKGKADGPTEKLKGDFDRDCVRLDDGHVRVGGNTSLWAINLANNARITPAGVDAVIATLQRREPAYETAGAFDGNTPDHYCVPSLAIERFDVAHSQLDDAACARLRDALVDFAAYRTAAALRNGTPANP